MTKRRSLLPLLRRTFLRGAGATTVALPLLPSLGAGAQGAAYPKRLVVWWVPEGMARNWKPSGSTDLPGPLSGLAAHRDQVSVLRGFHNDASQGHKQFDLHDGGPRTILNGGHGPARQVGGVQIPSGQTLDQIVGNVMGGDRVYATYELGIQNHLWDAQKAQVSFNRAGAPRNANPNPRKAFEELLGSVAPTTGPTAPSGPPRRLLTRRSVLDSVNKELAALQCELDANGRAKVEAHTESLRTIERQIDTLVSGGATRPGAVVPSVDVPGQFGDDSVFGDNDRVPEVGELQMRIAASALAARTTQVITFHWGHTSSNRRYTWIPGLNYPNVRHHDLSHSCCQGPAQGNSSAGYADLEPIFRWYFQQFSFFLDLLASIPEGDGTLLDHTLVLYCSEFGDPDHSQQGGHRDIPFVIAGMGETFRLGQNFNAGGRPHNDLLLAILHGFGIDIPEFGEGRYNRGPFNDILR